ncbi:GAF domain-containing protein [Chitinophaga skermanii]|uniref:GAF domain-containing protein n=1 Tax=Chitinophaga skermanii TaxID=331697 RepID=A0A327QC55_9BACT|nr:histidine kinase [Chitinophaga skermanii]RAJ01555.1 GAF domain-containing protein [Chitinophaga skermanii]
MIALIIALVTINRYKKRYQAQAMVNYFATSLFGKNTVEDILWDIAKNCIGQLHFEDCVMYLVDENNNKLVQKAAFGAKNPQQFIIHDPIEIPIGQGIVGSVAASAKAEIVSDTTQDSRYILDDQQRFSEITVPIIYEGKVIGIIDSEHSRKHFYTQQHLALLENIAMICALKIGKTLAEEKAHRQDIEVQHLHKQLAELRLVTLKSQVNPHFLFNCLNGIYYCILNNEVEKASTYLSKFAKLLRMVLMHAEKNFISLHEEIEMLQHYLHLESLRVDKPFEFNISVSEQIDLHQQLVPGMLIQPFLENAIWHGLMNKNGDRQLHINWQQQNGHLTCEITDNGVGRKQAAQNEQQSLKQNKHVSKGMLLCMERVELYKSLFNTHFSIDVEDLYSDNQLPAGTKVLIQISRIHEE